MRNIRTTATSAVRAMIAAFAGNTFSAMLDAYRPPDRDNPRWPAVRIKDLFDDIVHGRFVPTCYQQSAGVPYRRENDGPTADWRGTATAIWAVMPKNDSAIFDRPADTSSPRHAKDAGRLAPLLKFAKARDKREPLSTNWLQPDNDNYHQNDDEGDVTPMATNAERRIRPGASEEEAKSWIAAYKAGKLRVSDGEQHESAIVLKNDRTVGGAIRIPAGAILNSFDKFGALLGAEPDAKEIERRRSYWASLMSYDREAMAYRELEPVRHIKAGRTRRKVKLTHAEQLELLKTQPHPPTTRCKTGLPCGGENIADSFLGGWISSTKGRPVLERWQDISDELSRQAEFEAWSAALPPEERRALNLACTAANFREIGEAFGKTGKTAERKGKAIVFAANDNLAEAIAAAA